MTNLERCLLAALRQARDAAVRDEPGAAERLARAIAAWREHLAVRT